MKKPIGPVTARIDMRLADAVWHRHSAQTEASRFSERAGTMKFRFYCRPMGLRGILAVL